MKTFYSPAHLGHALTPDSAVELPERAENVRAEIEARKLGPVLAPETFPDAAIEKVHRPELLTAFKGAPGGSAFDADTPILRGTYAAARSAVDVVLSGAETIRNGERGAFGLVWKLRSFASMIKSCAHQHQRWNAPALHRAPNDRRLRARR